MVNCAILQQALVEILPLFPGFRVVLKRGVFWYYLQQTDKIPRVEGEVHHPCMGFKGGSHFLFRVLYYRKRIALECSHTLTDGTGALIFLKSLLVHYFKLKGIDSGPFEGVIDHHQELDEPFLDQSLEDSFKKYYKKVPPPEPLRRAYHLPFKKGVPGWYGVITGTAPVKKVIALAKQHQVSLTVFLMALYFESILEIYRRDQRSKNSSIILNIPVNLRGLYPSKTLRNFFVAVTPELDLRLGDYTFDEILNYCHHFMKTAVNQRQINRQIRRNVDGERRWWIRLVPLKMKDIVLPIIYNRLGESRYSSGLSNLGLIKIPPELEPHIERFNFIPPPSGGNLIKAGVLSYRGELLITFGKITTDATLERIFFRKLRKLGVPVKIETNIEERG